MNALLWSIVLLLAGIGLIGLEIFVPSGGVLSVLAVLAVVAAIVVAFTGGIHTGMIMLVTTAVVIPLVVAAVIRWWPYTPIGRMIVLHTPLPQQCPGQPPQVVHSAPPAATTNDDLALEATVTDDKGLKAAPVVYYPTTAPPAPSNNHLSTLQQT